MAEPSREPRRGALWQRALRYSTVGLELGMAVAFGFLFGRWVDGKLGSEPYLMLVFGVLGAVAGMRNLYRAARRAMKESEQDDSERRER